MKSEQKYIAIVYRPKQWMDKTKAPQVLWGSVFFDHAPTIEEAQAATASWDSAGGDPTHWKVVDVMLEKDYRLQMTRASQRINILMLNRWGEGWWELYAGKREDGPNNEREPKPRLTAKGKPLTVIVQEWRKEIDDAELAKRAWSATMAAVGSTHHRE